MLNYSQLFKIKQREVELDTVLRSTNLYIIILYISLDISPDQCAPRVCGVGFVLFWIQTMIAIETCNCGSVGLAWFVGGKRIPYIVYSVYYMDLE